MMKSPDQLDLASEYEAENLRLALEKQRASREPELPVSGCCYNCGEPLAVGLFCAPIDAPVSECFTDWEARRKQLRQRLC